MFKKIIIRTMILSFVIIISANSLYSQSLLLADNCELVLQSQGDSTNTIRFELTPVGDEYCSSSADECNISEFTGTSSEEDIVIDGDTWDCTGNGFVFKNCSESTSEISSLCGSGTKATFRFGRYEIKVYEDNLLQKTFFYDNRDCHFPKPGCVDCSGICVSSDITIRFMTTSDLVFMKSGSRTDSTTSGWIPVGDSTNVNWWIEDSCSEHCDILDMVGPPQTPSRITITGGDGENPLLSWNANSECDLDGYKIYRSDQGSAYTLLATVDDDVTSYTDHDVEISENREDPDVCYKHLAFDEFDNESGYSMPRCIDYSRMSKLHPWEFSETNIRKYDLYPNYPNPFNPETKISFSLPTSAHVSIKVYDTNGNEITTLLDEQKERGVFSIVLNLGKVNNIISSGVYIVTMQAGSYMKSIKVNYLK